MISFHLLNMWKNALSWWTGWKANRADLSQKKGLVPENQPFAGKIRWPGLLVERIGALTVGTLVEALVFLFLRDPETSGGLQNFFFE